MLKASGQVRRHRAKVLVAAPSNAALDEIVLRLLATGLRDAAGDSYSPSIVRAGLNAHHSVAAVTMDALVTQRMASLARAGASAAARAGSTGMERDRIRTAILDEAAIVSPATVTRTVYNMGAKASCHSSRKLHRVRDCDLRRVVIIRP